MRRGRWGQQVTLLVLLHQEIRLEKFNKVTKAPLVSPENHKSCFIESLYKLSAGVCGCRWLFFCCCAASMPLLDLDFKNQASRTEQASPRWSAPAAPAGRARVCLHILILTYRASSVEFWCSWKNFRGLPRRTGSERISLPANCDTATSRRAPRGWEESGKEDDGRVFVPLPLCLQKQITVGEAHEVNFGHPAVLFPPPPPPFSPCQIFKVCIEAVIIYSSLPFCPSLPAPSITTFNFTAELKNKQTRNCLKMLFKKYDKVKTRKSSCVLNQDGHY